MTTRKIDISNDLLTIQSWMITRLGLSGNELFAYAIIYRFSQDGKSSFCGSLEYVCEWLGVTKRTAINTLNSLVSKGFIEKSAQIVNGNKRVEYKAVLPGV